jgi:hypothetical protein
MSEHSTKDPCVVLRAEIASSSGTEHCRRLADSLKRMLAERPTRPDQQLCLVERANEQSVLAAGVNAGGLQHQTACSNSGGRTPVEPNPIKHPGP